LILLLIFVVRTNASDCLEDRVRNDLQCDVSSLKPYSLTHSLRQTLQRKGVDPFPEPDSNIWKPWADVSSG